EGELTLPGRGGPGPGWEVRLRSLGPELHLLEGIGRAPLVPKGPARVGERLARLLWSLHPATRLRAFAAVLEHGGTVEGVQDGSVDVGSAGSAGLLDAPVRCRDRRDELLEALAGRTLRATR